MMKMFSLSSLRLVGALLACGVVTLAPSCKNTSGGSDAGGYPGSGSWGNGSGDWSQNGQAGGGGAFDDGSSGNSVALPSRREGTAFFGPGSENVQRGEFEPVLFDFDRFDIRPDQQDKVRRVAAAAISRNSSLLIAGFTDATGTEEYNRVLGERRALSVRSALISQGVRADLVQTVSFGEDMPASGNDAENRRAEFGFVR